jgi:2-polyprenyl-3-methyl-5-hydroxy-6-metoxy-1,4-benzoquinol methylase
MPNQDRFANEIDHSRYLATSSPEDLWGWGGPAGRLRAQRRAELIVAGAKIGPGSRVLEIGCGTGLFTEHFAESGADIVAVDLSPELLDLARRRGLERRVQFLERNFEDCDAEGPFDAVIGNSVLHHLDLDQAWRKIHSLLKPGGRISFAEPNMLNPQVYAERHFQRFFPYVSPDETAFVRWALARTLKDNGFSGVRITPFDWLHPATPATLIPLLLCIGRVIESTWVAREFSGSLAIWGRRP